MKIQASNRYILIELVDRKKLDGIILPEGTAPLNPYGRVLSVGPKCTETKIGDRVLILPNGPIGIKDETGRDVFIVDEGCVLGKYVEDNISLS